jgi:alanyl-tRNA synthetase
VERIEFAAGLSAVEHIQSLEAELSKAAEALEVPVERVGEAARQLKEEVKRAMKRAERAMMEAANLMASKLLDEAAELEGLLLVEFRGKEMDREDLIKVGEAVVKREPKAVAVMVSQRSDGIAVVIMAGREAVKRGAHAGRLTSTMCAALGGKGGGREELGQGGAPSLDRLEEALKALKEEVKASLRL